MTESIVDLQLHQRRVGLVLWHPSALNVLLTAGSDNLVIIWNVGTGEALVRIDCHPDVVYSACWNWDGSRLVTTCKDKKIRILDPRSGEVLEEAVAHEGSKATRAIFLRYVLLMLYTSLQLHLVAFFLFLHIVSIALAYNIDVIEGKIHIYVCICVSVQRYIEKNM